MTPAQRELMEKKAEEWAEVGCDRHKQFIPSCEECIAPPQKDDLFTNLAKALDHPDIQVTFTGWKAELEREEAKNKALAERCRVLEEAIGSAIENIAHARSEASSVNISRDYIIDECCLAISALRKVAPDA